MNCQDIERGEVAERYFRGELDAAAQDNFEIHILECRNCLHVAETLQAVHAGLTLRAQEIRALAVPAGKPWPRWALAGGLAAVCLLGVIYFGWSRRHRGKNAAAVHTSSSSVAVAPQTRQNPSGDVGKSPSSPKTASAASSGTGGQTQAPSPAKTAASPAAQSSSPNPATHDQNRSLATFVPGAAAKEEERHDIAEAALSQLEIIQKPAYVWPGPVPEKPRTGQEDQPVPPAAVTSTASEAGRTDFQEAMVAYLDGRYRVAIALLEDDLKVEPLAPDTNFYLGACYILMGRPGDSVAPLKTASQNGKGPLRQSAHFYLAKAYLQTRQLPDAETEYQAAASLAGPLKQDAASELARLRAIRAAE